MSKKLPSHKSQDWLKLCNYVKTEILGYDNNMKFPKFLALRLQGLSKGQFIANKNQSTNANYSFEVILKTFKKLKIKILLLISNKTFKNEFSKINYIMTIVENEINDVVLATKNENKASTINPKIDLKLFNSLKNSNCKITKKESTKGDCAFNEVTRWMW